MIFKTNRLQKEELPSFCRVKTNLMDNPMISLNQRDSETFDLNFKEITLDKLKQELISN